MPWMLVTSDGEIREGTDKDSLIDLLDEYGAEVVDAFEYGDDDDEEVLGT